jgi:hypothetical protein
MCEIQLAGVEGLLHMVSPDDFMNSNPHEWMMFRWTPVVDVLGPARRGGGSEKKGRQLI